jgi:hypothetical protein
LKKDLFTGIGVGEGVGVIVRFAVSFVSMVRFWVSLNVAFNIVSLEALSNPIVPFKSVKFSDSFANGVGEMETFNVSFPRFSGVGLGVGEFSGIGVESGVGFGVGEFSGTGVESGVGFGVGDCSALGAGEFSGVGAGVIVPAPLPWPPSAGVGVGVIVPFACISGEGFGVGEFSGVGAGVIVPAPPP